jgi:hypothetical protein
MSERWRGGANIGALYRVADERDLARVGNCWMSGRLRVGDLLLCLAHSGDCFYDYMLVKEYDNGLEGIPRSKFGAYVLGEPSSPRLTSRQYHLLAAGEFVKFGAGLQG